MSWIVDALVGPGAAGITGLFGGMVSKFFEVKAQKTKLQFETKMRQLDIEESKLERDHELEMADKQMERAQVEGDIAIQEGEIKAFTASQVAGNSAEGFLRFVRPFITFYLLFAATGLFSLVWGAVGGLEAFSHEELVTMLKSMVETALYVTVMAVGWWFASRGGNIKFK